MFIKEQVSFVLEDFSCQDAGVLLFLPENKQTKKEWRKHICQKNITFMSTDKGLKSASRYTKSTGENENTKSIWSRWTEKTTCSFFYRDVSLLSSQSVRNNNPPAMRVRDRCYTKKSPFRSIIELFKLNNTNRKVILWQTKRTACLIQNGCVNITLCLLQNTGEK
mgnify:CR=1 FL=1